MLEWVKLPQDLQHHFFKLAEEEAEKLSESVRRLSRQLGELKARLQPYIHSLPGNDMALTVAAVDSSRSPRLSERLGVRYGVFATGAVYLKGVESREETFRAGVFKRKQALSQDKSKYLFDLLTTYTERKLALEALDRCDLLILDGSFYGFIYGASLMKKTELYGDQEEEIVKKIFEMTEELRRSGKTVGVIKRSHTRSIGGYLAFKHGDSAFTSIIDKLILSMLMPENSYFRYQELIGEEPVQIYSGYARLVSIGWSEGDLMEEAEKRAYRPLENLKLDKEGLKKMRRMQVRFHRDTAPCEIEFPASIGKKKLLEWFGQKNFFNEATNLPMALDLVDNMVGLSAKFTEEFVSEVEGRMLETVAENLRDQEAVKTFFTLLNPQKPY
ncbi:DNA double-strand break repair nuclease NurA [Candidatus Hecatella orcuttiae]|jgi:hypothetical protein|uniref:DNA double-strand break repair nuclease NurA n=1 Tax=Candidatus Hecatella orcuttiae TaxID=1935119 RepID=UPI002867DF46|nr:DNA double-strand break repair nuclease NurA [Candidatus Hecatella orcuttiae]